MRLSLRYVAALYCSPFFLPLHFCQILSAVISYGKCLLPGGGLYLGRPGILLFLLPPPVAGDDTCTLSGGW